MSALTEEAVKARVRELLARANDPSCPTKLSPTSMVVSTTFDLKGRAAGMCRTKKTESGLDVTIRINRKAMEIDGGKFMIDEVIPHEIAHAFAMTVWFDTTRHPLIRKGFKGHGIGWKQLAIWLGASGSRTCSVGLEPFRRMKRFLYRASCGTEVKLSAQKHHKIQRGQKRVLTRTGGKIAAEHFVSEAA